ncbi:MAG TPA: FAD-dependent oxidoreductase [Terriglobia bacterium]|nr:FAD-dependent oxidoreductase [Terriglobia bacterium]
MRKSAGTSHTADVLVIGGGLIGCSIALRLAQAGLRVCVLDRGEPGGRRVPQPPGCLHRTARRSSRTLSLNCASPAVTSIRSSSPRSKT